MTHNREVRESKRIMIIPVVIGIRRGVIHHFPFESLEGRLGTIGGSVKQVAQENGFVIGEVTKTSEIISLAMKYIPCSGSKWDTLDKSTKQMANVSQSRDHPKSQRPKAQQLE
jgi:hypothetical protein